MCGICGIINFDGQKVNSSDLEKMMKRMKHRGPDDEGIFTDNNCGLGFVRLSILDLSSAGNQPMFSSDNRYVIVFNGEVFNYVEIRKELSSKYAFQTNTDTEVILASFQEWGQDCVNMFNGMWAFVIYDKIEKTLFISRDRFGIKPFFYYIDKNRLIFASDIPPILEVLHLKPQPDDQSIYDYLVFNRTNHTEKTFFKNIKKLPHAHNIIIQDKNMLISKWYDLRKKVNNPFNNEAEFIESLLLSIKQQLRSDVPVGACLSGGLDSSTIVSLILKYFDKPFIHTFSAVYEKGMKEDESYFIEEFNDLVRNMHFTKPTAGSLLNEINTFVEAMVEPIPGTSEYAEFKVMELAKKHCTVILNGQGADEEMAGYLVFFGYFFKELFFKYGFLTLLREIKAYKKYHPSNIGIVAFLFFLLPNAFKNNITFAGKNYISKDFSKRFKASPELTKTLYGSNTLKESLLNHFEYKFEHHLIWADRSGMWFSLETRFPFLDHRFVERVLALNHDKIIYKGITKKILRDSMVDILPESIRMRMDKVGYETPEDDWFRTPNFQSFIQEIINSDSFRRRNYFDPDKIDRDYKRHLNRKINIGKDIWKWVHLELWFRIFID